MCTKLSIHVAYSAKRFGNKFDTKCVYPVHLYDSKLSPIVPSCLFNYCRPRYRNVDISAQLRWVFLYGCGGGVHGACPGKL